MDNNIYSRIAALSLVESENTIWFSSAINNGLYSIDKTNGTVSFLGYFPDEEVVYSCLYYDSKKINKYLLFAPHVAKNITLYDIEKKIFIQIEIKQDIDFKYANAYIYYRKFWKTVSFENCVYFLGYTYPAIVKYNISENSVNYITDWVDKVLIRLGDDNYRGFLSDGYIIRDKHIIVPIASMSALLSIDVSNDTTSIIEIDTCFNGIGGIAGLSENEIVLVGRGKNTDRIILMNIETKCSKTIMIPDVREIIDPFYAPITIGNDIILMPIFADHAYKVSIEENISVEIIPTIDNVLNSNKINGLMPFKTMAAVKSNGIIRFITGYDLIWHEYNYLNGTCISYSVDYPNNLPEYNREWFKYAKDNNSFIPELRMSLADYADFICEEKNEVLHY